jgi:enterochelin esterase-like enzyme
MFYRPHPYPSFFRARVAPLFVIWAVFLYFSSPMLAVGQPSEVTPAQHIRSEILGYTSQYWVYKPAGYDSDSELPVLFLSDGAWYLDPGNMPQVLDSLISAQLIEPVLAVFLDARIPENVRLNRRTGQFFCNQKYIDFYKKELIPTIDETYKTRKDRRARAIAGLSFGGLNSACFGLHANDVIEGIAMQSPATHPVRTIHQAYQDSVRLPIRIFLSSGDHKDNEAQTRKFRDILQEKGYPLKYIEVPFAHNWENWGPLLDDLLLYFYGTSDR